MRIFSFGCLLVASLLLSSCLTIIEQYQFNADGSGHYSGVVDMSRMISNPMFAMAMAEQLGENPDEFSGIDTSFNMYDQLAAANPQWTEQEANYIKRIEARMQLDFDSSSGGIFIDYDFSSTDELKEMQRVFQSANQPETEGGLGSLSSGFGNNITSFEWGRGKMSRTTEIVTDMNDQLGIDEDQMDMMASMFGDARLIYIMEFPGRIKKVEGFPGAQNTGNTLTFEFPFLEMLNNPSGIDEALDGSVKFKRR